MYRFISIIVILFISSTSIADEITITRKFAGWTVVQEFDLIYQQAESHAYTNSVNQSGGRQFDERELILYCADEALKLYIHWELWHLIGDQTRLEVTTQFDSEPSDIKNWFVADNERYTFLQGSSVADFIDSASQHETLRVSTVAGDETLRAEYELKNFKEVESMVLKYCVYDEELVKKLKEW